MVTSKVSVLVTSFALFLGATLPGCKEKQDPNSGELVQKNVAITPPLPIPETPEVTADNGKPTLGDRGRELVKSAKDKLKDAKTASREKMSDLAERVGERAGIGEELKRVILISDEELVTYGRNIALQMDSTNTIVQFDDPRAQRLSRLVSPHANEAGLSLSVKLYDSPTINAFSLPDGSIRFFTGLLDNLNDEQLRAVLGHEIGHIVNGHAKDRMRVALLAKAGGKLLLDEKPGLGDEVLVFLGRAYVNAAFSRSNEHEADDYALKFMQKHNYDSKALVELLDVFASLEARYGRGIFTMFASHPAAEERADRIEERIK